MDPVRGYTMINFLHWLASHHPEIKRLRDLPKMELLMLVDEFEGGKLQGNERLKEKWLAGFRDFLFNGDSNWAGYDRAREELNALEQRRR